FLALVPTESWAGTEADRLRLPYQNQLTRVIQETDRQSDTLGTASDLENPPSPDNLSTDPSPTDSAPFEQGDPFLEDSIEPTE
ncbi:MAG: hypothetical protein ACO4CG_12500, partial [Prochlorothrix sp.]